MPGLSGGPASSAHDAVLEGGPASLPVALRSQRAAGRNGRIKVLHGASYEHFEHTGECRSSGDGDVLVYRWIMRTRIAE